MSRGTDRRLGTRAMLLLAVLLAGGAVRAQAAEEKPGWSYRLTPYLWFTGIEGTLGAGGRTGEADVSFSDALEDLDFAAMLTFEARKGKTLLLLDSFYLDLSDDADTPGGLFSSADFIAKQLVLDLAFGSFVKESPKGSTALLVGVRYWNLKNELDLRAGALPAQSVDDEKDWFDPLIGVMQRWSLSPKWDASLKADMGGFGVGSDLTWQIFLGFNLALSAKSGLVFGYRYLDMDYEDDGFTYDVAMQGPVLGYQFRF